MTDLKSTCSREDFWLVHLVLLVTVCAQVVNAGTWGQWRGWSGCSQTCGNGFRERSRVCEIDIKSASCSTEIKGGTDVEPCKVVDCPLQECGGTMTDDAGFIQSPNYPDNYPAEANCTWKLVAQSGYYFELEVISFSLESSTGCRRDYVTIEGVNTNGYAYCGRVMLGTMKSMSNEVSIHFASDDQTGDKGFSFKYTRKVIPKCDGGDNFCYNGGTCSGINECDCKLGFIGYRCSYIVYDKTTNDAEPSGEFHFPSKVCSMYGADHVETFENHKYQLSRACQYMMAKFGNTEEILVRRDVDCPSTRSCLKKVEISFGSSSVVKISRDGVVNFDGQNVTGPISKYGFGISQTKWHIFILLNDWRLIIDKKDFSLFLTADPGAASQAKGICSIAMNDNNSLASVSSTDMFLFTHEWEQNDVGESCTSDDATTSPCPDDQTDQESVCNVLYTEAFDECRLNISVDSYYKQCLSDLCQCSIEQTDDCHCSVVSKYARDCARAGFAIGKWRTATSCERTCPGNKVFLECAKSCPATCENTGFGHCNEECTDGCQCVEGKYWDGSWCVSKDECPCSHAGRKYKPGETVIEGCKHRVCLGSIWNYTEVDCPATASAVGFSHFQTFDGSWFDFPASKCEYLFVEDKSEAKSFSIYVTAEPCGSHSRFSCIRKVKVIESISSHSYYVTLLQNGGVLSQNNILAALPTTNGGITVRRITSIYIEAVIADLGVSVLWNGRASLHVTVPKSFTEKLHGLCGNYNSRTVDDLTDKSGVVSAPVVFGNSWKQPAECPDVDSINSLPRACSINQHLAESAKEQCDILKGPLFATCRRYVPYDTYYTNCKEDVCACEAGSDCLCDAVAVYAYECIKVGVEVNWRSNDFCHKTCSNGQSFQRNGTLCSRTCRSRMQSDVRCSEHGVEGCACPEEMYLSKDGSCVQLEDCPCYWNQEWITPGHVSHPGASNTCTCSNGVHMCYQVSSSTKEEQKTCPAGMARRNCTVAANNNQCTPTCNYLNQTCPQTTCTPECICENGLVRHNDQCIEASECPCVRDGKEFTVGDDLVDGCTILTCQENSRWQINETNCYDQCKVVAGIFYTTFDDKHYQFNGFCEYILATDDCGTQLSSTTSGNFMYRITVKSQDCPGSNRAMCETTVHIIIGALEITLRTGQKPVLSNMTSRQFGDLELVTISSNTHGNYFIVKSSNGLQIDWDQKTTVYVRMDRSLREKYPPCGMCGNNDGDSSNDFKTMNNDITTSPAQFGNSWKLLSHCADALEVSETCHRGRTWAEQQCEVINTAFKHCHAKVDPRYYYNKCVEATCTCDVVGDCECFCSSVADYAYACGQHNIEVDWRTPSLCPIMCPNNNTDDACLWRYKACSTCYETCCNPILCIDGCYEGCYPNCKSGTVFDELANACVVKQSCSTQDCVLSPEQEPPSSECQTNEKLVCDWSPWKNTNKPSSASNGEFELFKNLKKLEGMCSSPKEIECRSVNSTTAERQTVTCDTQHGLVCYNEQNPSMCDDYEVRFNCCQCVTTCNETCSPPPACKPNEESENITSQDDCCPKYVCKCIGCYHDGHLKSPGEEWIENCETMRCSDNGKGCYNITTANRVECSSVDCPFFAKNVPTPGSLYGKSVEECCSTNCTCRDEYQPGSGAHLNCTYPEVRNVTRVTHELLSCEISTCTCPHSDMETTHCVNETSCSPAGCHAEPTYSCGCAISSACVCNPADCPEPKNCSRCYELVSRPAGIASFPDTRCETSTCCSVDTCEPIQCNNTEAVECGANEIRTKVPVGECCTKEVCICELCVDEQNNKYKIGDYWPDYSDPSCVTKVCTRDKNKQDECPVIGILKNKRETCLRVNEVSCKAYERKVQYAVDECCFDWNCTCDPNLCRTNPETCEAGHELVVDHEASNNCCNVTKCCETTCVVDGYRYQDGEEWTDGCERRRCGCDGDGCCEVEQIPRCPKQVVPTCVNNEKPVAVSNPKDPCCPEYQCRCVCDVFGDPHYVTFDNSYYTYMGKCTYSLVTYRNSSRLHIYSDNTVCNPDIEATCLKRIFVKWDDSLVEFYYNESRPFAQSVSVNNVILQKLPWSQSGIEIKLVNNRIVLTIPEIELEVFYSKFSLPCTTIIMSMSKMFNETVGLCGTCSNNKDDDYEGRNETLFTYVRDFGASWRMNGTDEECECDSDKDPRCSCWNERETSENCMCPSDNCDILKSDIFKECHTYVNPDNFISACRQDGPLGECGGCNSTSFPVYAEKCETNGVCIDWRSALNCTAPTCSDGFEHKSCVRACDVERTCDNYMDITTCTDNQLMTGCFCKPGLVLKTSGSNECIEPSCCSCPQDLTCPPNQILQVVPGDEASCCPKKTCVCTQKFNPDYCKPPLKLQITNTSCPICECPECSSVLPNCTQKPGCRLKTLEKDDCGCVKSGICECDPRICPKVCGKCLEAVAVERNTSSETDECENCCAPWKCRPVTCSPDYNKDPIPEGYQKMQDNGECCPKIYCASCRLDNGSFKWPGETWYESENGCRVKKLCSDKRDSSDSCHKSTVMDDGTSHCLTQNQFEELNCNKSTEVAVKSESNGSCCTNYTCTCNPNPPFVLCSYPEQEKVKVYPKDKNCPIEKCVCKNNSGKLCPNYRSVDEECQAHPSKEVVKTNETTGYGPCCPRFRCDCKNCSELVDNTTCPRGFTQDTKFDGCCNRTGCKCNSCMNEKGEHFEVGATWWELDKSGCNTSYSCKKTNSFTNEGCYTPTASPRVCSVPECSQYTTRTEIQYNASYPDPDLCCPEYNCSCNPCPSGYKPPPTNVSDHYHIEIKNMTNPCCPTWSLICDVCQRSDGSTMNRGSSTNETYEDGCPVTYACTDQRIGNDATACFVIDEISNRRTCLHKDDFELSCNTTYQHAVEIAYSNGESDPNLCCTEYTCSCKNSDTLATICPTTKFNYEVCNQSGRKSFTFTAVPSTYGCCTEPSCPCFNELELVNHCPLVNSSCEYGEDLIKYTIEGECCPQYNCTCSSCPTDYQPYPNAPLAPYEKYDVIKSPGWKCCPTYEIVCNDTSQCPVPTCAANRTLVKLPDQHEPDTNGCCPKYVCRCDVCVLQDGSLKQVGDSWNEQVDGGCSLTLSCMNQRLSSSSSALESCHKTVVTSDPRDWCRTKTQFESKSCNNYTEAVLKTDDKDSDPCCDDYICTCKSDDQLKTVCPNDMNESCSVYMEKTEVGTISGTNDCCPEYACTCQADEVLSSVCQQWDDYECPFRKYRYMIRERNNATGPCCPEFGCICLPDEMLAPVCEHWNFSCPHGQKRVKTIDDCCPTYECVCDKCVYDQGIYPVNTTFPIGTDQCLQGVCVLNVTSNCPEAVIQKKYKCPFVNETDCRLRGGKLVANETVQGCCEYCCSCPEDPTCPPNHIPQVVPGDEASCCPKKTCVCVQKFNPDYCKPPLKLQITNTSCPICECPECSSVLPNCTQKPGCRLKALEKDDCGCVKSGICECDPRICPKVCGKCLEAVAVERNTSSETDECENCCAPWKCRPVTCSPDYNKDPIPEGYQKMQDNGECCPKIYCASCRLDNGSFKWPGETWYESENGCRVKKLCSDKRDSSDSCHKSTVMDDGTSHCLTQNQFEELNCNKSTEVAVKSESNGSCCTNYTCTCNPNPPFVLCSYPEQEKVKVYPKDKNCPIEKCVCKNNSGKLCPNYRSVDEECQAHPSKEVVKTNETTGYGPCCPRFRCDCKNCSELVDNTTCPRGFTQDTKFDGCCNRTGCKCNSCMNEKGEHFEVGATWWELDKSGCNTSYSCKKTNSFTNEGCYTPTASPRVCSVPECSQYTTRTEIQYNASYPDPDLCCPEYNCSCNPCPSGYKPPPTNVSDHYHIEIKNMTNPCCPTWSLICDVCQRSDGSTMNRGSSTNETYEDGCPVTYACTDQRIGNDATACFVIDEISNRRTCLHKDDFELSCNTTYQHAVEIAYSNGESDPNLCCTEYTCSCKNSDTLATICPTTKFNYEVCNQSGRKSFTFTAVPSTYGCCTEPSCPCFNELELVNHCPLVNSSCEYGEDLIKYTIEGECCPQYNCTCSSCPTDYQPYPNAPLAPYEKYDVIKSPGWKCCPTYEIVCNDTSQCPVPTCAANRTLVKLPDQHEPDTNGCCPKYVCRCDVCVLQDGSLKQVGDSWNEQVDGGCSLTLSCMNQRLSSSSSALESCHKTVVTSDPRDWCRTKTQFESKSCNNYTEAVLKTDDKDSDPCCDDYICTCKSDDQLKTVCPNDMNESCSVYMEKTLVGTISGTNDCCPEYACTCQSDEVLSSVCQQWDDYECPLGNKRYMLQERNNATGPCCPEFGCTCLPDEMLAQVCEHWNFSCPHGEKRVKTNDDCCPTYECVCDKCVYDQGIYPVNTTFPIGADQCLQGVCALNVTSNCPEAVIQEKYKCPFLNETDCLLRGGRLVANETVQGCCKYCEPTPAPCKQKTDRLILNATIDTHTCRTMNKVNVNFCTGSCPTTHEINAETGKMEGLCQCCKSLSYSSQTHSMICDDGYERQYTQKVIFECGCKETSCEARKKPRSSPPIHSL